MFLAKGPYPFFISSYQTKTFLDRKVTEANAIKILFPTLDNTEKEKRTSFSKKFVKITIF
jgi:hypothetical protein